MDVCVFLCVACAFVSPYKPAITLQGVHVQHQIYCLLSASLQQPDSARHASLVTNCQVDILPPNFGL